MTKVISLCILLVSAAGAAYAEPFAAAKKAPEPPSVVVSDADLDAARASMGARFAQRASAVKKTAAEQAVFFVGISAKRLDYDRHAIEERRAFYGYLKTVAMNERQKALKNFDAKQKDNRRKFDKNILTEETRWFKDNIEKLWKSASLMSEEVSAAAQRVDVAENEDTPVEVNREAKKPSRAAAKRKSSSKRARSSSR